MQVSIGRILQYKLTEQDVERISRRRTNGGDIAARIAADKWPLGAQAHIGNPHHVGQVLPLIVAVVWPNEYGKDYHGVNGQVILDGNDQLWVCSVKEGTEDGTWSWPVKQESAPESKECLASPQLSNARHKKSVENLTTIQRKENHENCRFPAKRSS